MNLKNRYLFDWVNPTVYRKNGRGKLEMIAEKGWTRAYTPVNESFATWRRATDDALAVMEGDFLFLPQIHLRRFCEAL